MAKHVELDTVEPIVINGRLLRDCICPACRCLHFRHLSAADIEGLPVDTIHPERVSIICAGCLGKGNKNPPSYQSWKPIGGGKTK